MTASILLVTGGDDFARRLYADEGHADWGQAMPLVLEKLGYLDFDVAGPEAVADEATWSRPGVILISSLPAGAWDARAIELAGSGRARALIECPPAALRVALGVSEAAAAEQEGVVAALDDDLRAAVEASTTFTTTRIEFPQSRPVPRDEDLDWDRLGVPISPQQAERWRAPGWRVERWSVSGDAKVLAEWVAHDGEARWPAIIARGRLIATCFSMFGLLGQQTTIQPLKSNQYINWPRSTALEVMLATLMDRMHRHARVPRVRVMPWPAGANWVLSVRHDYDRELPAAEIDRILALHRRAGTAATWYWRSRFVDGPDGSQLARRVDRTGGQEVAHHTEQLWRSATEEQRAIERAIGRQLSGSSAHGDPHCFRWQGAPNVLWAERAGLDYTEFISHTHTHPHRFSALRGDGTVEHSRVLCLPHHVSLDRSMSAGDAASDDVLAHSKEYMRAGGMMQILSHPDLNIEPLFELADRLPRDGRLDLTAADVADWWRRSHVRAELSVVLTGDGTVTLKSARGIRGLVIELLLPDGRRRRHVVQLDPGASIAIGTGVTQADPERRRRELWRRQAVPAFADVVRAYYAQQGISTNTQDVKTTIATNTDLVPVRVELICRYLRELQGVTSLRGLRVLDLGGGFGAFAVYLALDPDAPSVTTVDIRPEFVSTCEEVITRLGLMNLTARTADMRSLPTVPDGHFDIVILNNSFLYLTGKQDMRQAISEIERVLRPGGSVVFFHANRLRLTEPFTGAPIVHLLAPRLADRVSKITGWRHNHGRVLLVTAPWLARRLRQSGLTNVRTAAQGGIPRLRGHWLARFYAVSARKPAAPSGG